MSMMKRREQTIASEKHHEEAYLKIEIVKS